MNIDTEHHSAESMLPRSWTRLSLGEVGRWVGGGTPSRANICFWTDGTIPWVSPKDMKTDRLASAQEQITEAAVANSATNLVEKGSVLLVVRSGILEHTLPVAIAERQMALNQDLKAIQPVKEVDSDYLALALRAFGRTILRSCAKAGTTVASLELPKLLRFRIPIAPLPEQRRIVAEIEKQFTRLEAGMAALRRVQAKLKRYRAAVLKAACEGKLVTAEAELAHKERRSFEPGEQLLKRILAERRKHWTGRGQYKEPAAPNTANLPSPSAGWTWATFDQISSLITKGSSPNWQGFNYCDEGIIFVRSENVRWGALDLSGAAHLPPAFNDKERKSILREGDVLLNLVGASIGRSAIATAEVDGGNVNQAVAVIRLVAKIEMNQFAMLWLNSSEAQKRIHAEKVDVARANFSLEDTRVLQIPLPPLAEQTRIVAEVERRLSVVEELE
jgi:type I restriction enzyme, S subunit